MAASAADAAPGRPRVGLVLGGGGARGIAHVGVLKMLEELRIPVDCVAGTSMGSIIGGLYASGMTPEQMNETVQRIDWPAAFTDGPPRADLPFRTKQEQRILLTNNGVGIKDGKVQLPQGLLQGQNLLLLLEELSLPAAEIRNFDQLRVPYRAVATDLATGTPVVLKSGDLAMAMRASMSIPSALVPVKLDGKLLVDGGVSDNIPVDVVRELCRPDVIIAVDVGSPLAPASELNSLLSITGQLTTILTVRNAQQQIKTLGRKDILITPDLKDISSIDFDRSPEAVTIGYAAAQAKRKRAEPVVGIAGRLSSRIWPRGRNTRKPPAGHRLHPDQEQYPVVRSSHREATARQAGRPARSPGTQSQSQHHLRHGRFPAGELLAGRGRRQNRAGRRSQENYIGTDTLNFGLFLGANMKGDSLFNLSVAYTMSQLNSLGGQWRTFVQIGGNIKLETDFYQPLDADQEYFIDPYLSYQQYNLDVQAIPIPMRTSASFRVRQANIGMEVGRNLEHWGRLSLGLRYGAGSNDLRIGQIPLMRTRFAKAISTTAAIRSAGRRTRWITSTSRPRAISPVCATTAP